MALHDNKAVDREGALLLQLRYWIYHHLLLDEANDEFYLLFLYCIIFICLYQLVDGLLLLFNYVMVCLHELDGFLVLILVVLPYVAVGSLVIVHE